jgi:heme/copper-type cytochrome/quinol oxidase subunit 3
MLYIYLLEDLITDANTEEESTICISEKEEFPTGLGFFLLENISLFAVRFMVYGAHRHFQQYSSH